MYFTYFVIVSILTALERCFGCACLAAWWDTTARVRLHLRVVVPRCRYKFCLGFISPSISHSDATTLLLHHLDDDPASPRSMPSLRPRNFYWRTSPLISLKSSNCSRGSGKSCKARAIKAAALMMALAILEILRLWRKLSLVCSSSHPSHSTTHTTPLLSRRSPIPRAVWLFLFAQHTKTIKMQKSQRGTESQCSNSVRLSNGLLISLSII